MNFKIKKKIEQAVKWENLNNFTGVIVKYTQIVNLFKDKTDLIFLIQTLIEFELVVDLNLITFYEYPFVWLKIIDVR